MDAQTWLEAYLARNGGVAGSVHAIEEDLLQMRAAVALPPPVVAATKTIPCGKGMAGLAWERKAPVTTCNLQAPSKDVRPGAAAVGAKAAVALPILDAAGEVRAVVGIAYDDERDLPEALLTQLSDDAASLPG
ncbi:MAG: GAF domain-containing protein [Polyangiaceae bacterium]|nr:GAF domain-containing protein [Polyangiaceae bacterium]MCB9608734.1 GAF domain-containing protein [Polyangiaceae bacterium]